MEAATVIEEVSGSIAEPEARLVMGGWALVTRRLQVPVAADNRLKIWAESEPADRMPPTETQVDILRGQVLRLPNTPDYYHEERLKEDRPPHARVFHLGSVMLLERNGESLRKPLSYPNLLIEETGSNYSIKPLDGEPETQLSLVN